MSKIYKSITELVGNTPILEPENLCKKFKLKARLLIKLEYLNPTGSVKDRVAKEIIETAEKEGRLKPGGTIIEPTSGNTGIGLAAMGTAKGYKVIIVMPDTMSLERRKIMTALGAEPVVTDGALGMQGAIQKADDLKAEIEGSIIAGQFINPANSMAHYKTTGPEIWEDTRGEIDMLIAGIGTGGTISGTGKFLKEKKPNIEIIGIEPETSAVLSGEEPGGHGIQGIGAGFIPEVLDIKIYDKIYKAGDEESLEMAKELALTEGISVGISAGAALSCAVKEAKKSENSGKNIVCILPDSADRYFSTKLFE